MTYNSSKTGAQVDESVTKTQAAGTTVLGTGNTPIQSNATNLILDGGAKLGIGTTSPSVAVEALANTAAIRSRTASSTGSGALEVQSDTNIFGTFLARGSAVAGTLLGNPNAGHVQLFAGNAPLVLGTLGAFPFALGTNNTERLRIDFGGNLLVGTTSSPTAGNPKTVRYGTGVQANSLSNRLSLTAGAATTVLNMADVVSGATGTGLYLVTIVRTNGNVAVRYVGIVGVASSSTVLIYATLNSASMTVTASGANVQANVDFSGTFDCSAIPLAITP